MSSNPYLDLVKGGVATPTKTVTSGNPYLDLVKTPAPVKNSTISTSKTVPSGATKIKVPSGNEAYKTPSGSILEFMPDGTRQVTLAGQFGGGAYTTDPKNPNKIINTGHTTYGNEASVPGQQRDDIIPVGLGGLNSNPANIRLEKDLPQRKQSQFVHTPTDAMETKLAQDVKSGKTPLGQARVQNIITKQNETKPAPSQSTVGNFGRSLGEEAVTAVQLPKKTFYDPFAHPSDQTKQVESTLPTGNLLQRIAKNVSKPVIRATVPLVEGPANLFADRINTAQQANKLNNTPIQTVGKQAQSPIDPTMRTSNSSGGENVNDFLTLFGLGLALGAPSVIHEITSGAGDLLVNKEASAVITPKDLSAKLQSGEIKTPEGKQLAQHLIDTNSSIEIKGTESRGGAAQKVGEAIGGKEKPTTPQIKIVQGGTPIEAPAETPFSQELKKISSAEPKTPEQIQQQKLDSQKGSVNPGAVGADIKAGAQKVAAKVNDVQQFIKDTKQGTESSANLSDDLYKLQKNSEADKLLASKLLKNTDVSQKDAEAIYHYEEDKTQTLTPKQQEIYDTRIKPLADASSKIAEKLKPTGLLTSEDYTPRYVAGKGGVMDRLSQAAQGVKSVGGGGNGLLNKTAASLKKRTMKAIVDDQGNRTVVSIKGGRVTGFNNKSRSDLGGLKVKSNEQLLNEDIKPLQGKLTTLQKKLDGIGQIKIKDPVSQSRINSLYQELNDISNKSINLAEENSPSITKDIRSKTSDALQALGDLKERMGEKIVSSAETPKPYFNYEKEIPALEKKITDTQTRIEQLNVKSKDNLIARRDQAEKTRLMAQAKKLGERLKTLESVKKAADVTNIQGRIKAIQKKMVALSNEMSAIESKYNPDELNNKKFIDKKGKSYKITEATTKEIEQHTNLTYHKNVLANRVTNYLDLRNKERAIDFLNKLKESAGFKDIAKKFNEGIAPDGWRPTKLQNFAGYNFEPHAAATLDRFAGDLAKGKPGVVTKINSFLRTAIFFNPLIHIPNITVHWAVNRGLTPFLNPLAYGRFIKTTAKAFDAVIHQNSDYVEALRNGAPLVYGNEQVRQLQDLLVQKMTKELDNPVGADMKKIKSLFKDFNPYALSGKATWLVNDVATLQAIYEEMGHGSTMDEAIKDVGKHVPNYRISATVLNSEKLAKVLNDPNFTMFGAYHYGALKSYVEMAKDLVSGNGKEGAEGIKERAKVLDKLLMLGLIGLVIYPMMDKLAQKLTGNKASKFRRAGATTFFANTFDLAKGQMQWLDYLTSIVTPAVGTKEGLQLAMNKDIRTGQPIVSAPLTSQPKQALGQIGADLTKTIAPLDKATQIKSGKLSLKDFALSLFGISNPANVKSLKPVQTQIYDERPVLAKQVKGLYLQGKTDEGANLIREFNNRLLSGLKQAAQDAGTPKTDQQIKSEASQYFLAVPTQNTIKAAQKAAQDNKPSLEKLFTKPTKPTTRKVLY